MSRSSRLMLVLSTLSAGLAFNPFRMPAHAQTETEFVATMAGNQEVPPVITATRGRARVSFNDAFTKATFQLTVNKGKKVSQAHIHCNVAGMNGPIILFLAGFHAPGWNVDGEWVDNATLQNGNIVDTSCGSTLRQIARAMEQGRTYANAHTIEHPAGEVRGQLEAAP